LVSKVAAQSALLFLILEKSQHLEQAVFFPLPDQLFFTPLLKTLSLEKITFVSGTQQFTHPPLICPFEMKNIV
jgi:hypothetical protein